MLNKMCLDCTRLHINCDGTEKQCYCNCIYRVDNKKYPKYIKRDGYIGVFSDLEPGIGCKIPVYNFPGGTSMADDKELQSGSNNREDLEK